MPDSAACNPRSCHVEHSVSFTGAPLGRDMPGSKWEPCADVASDDECRPACPACFMGRHEGHDLGLRHEGGSLYSATCHDCDVTFQRATESMQTAIGGQVPGAL